MKKKYNLKNDPNKKEEYKKYKNPIPSREVILKLLEDFHNKYFKPIIFDKLFSYLDLKNDTQKQALQNRLKAMERDLQIFANSRKGFYSTNSFEIYEDKISLNNDKTGFLKHKKLEVFLNENETLKIFPNDTVQVKIIGLTKSGKFDGEIINIVSRNTKSVRGKIYQDLDNFYLQPLNNIMHNILIINNSYNQEKLQNLQNESLVEANIINYPSKYVQATCEINKVLEYNNLQEIIKTSLKTYNLPLKFPKEVIEQSLSFSNEVKDIDIKNRVDLRNLDFVTIDGSDAKDFDDAVYCEINKKTNALKLFVAIADVSYYVNHNSQIDIEAKKRGNSIYFPSFVSPMLPESLSNELCSLKPNQDRLALICQMNISSKGKLSRYKFYSAVIKSKARFIYNDVADFLDGNNNDFYKKYSKEILNNLLNLQSLYFLLNDEKIERGALDFNFRESKIILNQNTIENIIFEDRNIAHKIIEECMLLANISSAKFLLKNKKMSPFRIHEAPQNEKLLSLKKFLKTKNVEFNESEYKNPKYYNELLTSLKPRNDFDSLQVILLRSMNQAIYSIENLGHFGLALNSYTHFTSPIRRYSDLIVHRIIKNIINENNLGGFEYKNKNDLINICEHISTTERVADKASRMVEDWLKCDFLKSKIGETFQAKIVSLHNMGVFVEILENSIQGFLHVSLLPNDYFIFDSIQNVFIGEKNKKVYELGQVLNVELLSVNMSSLKIDFTIKGQKPNNKKSLSKKRNMKENKKIRNKK